MLPETQAVDREAYLAPAELMGDSPAMVRLREIVAKFAKAEAPVLISGESGTGKELVARAIHEQSDRRARPFIAVNCAAFPDALIEAELFGQEAGSGNGIPVKKREGRLQAAEGGTLLLDDVGELPSQSQPRLLRVLEERTFEPVGGNESVKVDVRLLSATHRSLKDLLAQGKFREDLYYRLKILEIDVPSLRERQGDVPLLISHFMKRFATPNAPTRISDEAAKVLAQHPFPGNVRELEHAIRHAMVLAADQPELRLEHLPPDIVEGHLARVSNVGMRPLHDALAQYEREYLRHALEACQGHKSATAALLGISRKNLWEKLKRYGIEGH
ncbi:MAG: sigma54 specific transcriptional regulator, Fis family [Myxococcaceae bacterium]|nr:sigma54 specific transcriptional regulator, Fis family [Myxococcaceae bacterium]